MTDLSKLTKKDLLERIRWTTSVLGHMIDAYEKHVKTSKYPFTLEANRASIAAYRHSILLLQDGPEGIAKEMKQLELKISKETQ